jgi:hypothetical protein
MVSETEIYLKLKKGLPERGWILIGGEPPDGTNSMPRIELKDSSNLSKGSKGSKKIDLVFFKNGFFLLLELKENYDYSDVKKLNEIVQEEKWRKAFMTALKEKRALELKSISINQQVYIQPNDLLIKAIAYSEGDVRHEDFVTFIIDKSGTNLHFGSSISENVRQLF